MSERGARGNGGDGPVFVAHRGAASDFPENTLLAVHGALAAGVRHIEVDVQLSADRVPVLMHDATLRRTAGVDRHVSATLARELSLTAVGELKRFGKRFEDACVPSLDQFVAAIDGYDDVVAFVEIKPDALHVFGRRRVLAAVLPVLDRSRHRIVPISFDAPLLAMVRERGDYDTGWVLRAYDEVSEQQARELGVRYLFCNERRVPGNAPLWRGPWDWVIYEITTLADARIWYRRGARLIESMAATHLAHAAGVAR